MATARDTARRRARTTVLARIRAALRRAVARRQPTHVLMSAGTIRRYLGRARRGWERRIPAMWGTCQYWQGNPRAGPAPYVCGFGPRDMMRLLATRKRVVLPVVVVNEFRLDRHGGGVWPGRVRMVDIRVMTLAQFRRQPEYATPFGNLDDLEIDGVEARKSLMYSVRVDGERVPSYVNWLHPDVFDAMESDEHFLGFTWAYTYLFYRYIGRA